MVVKAPANKAALPAAHEAGLPGTLKREGGHAG
jgi:hypothetical protein